MTDLLPASELARIRTAVDGLLPDFLRDLEALVNIDCGSYTKAGVDEVGRWVAGFLGELGAAIEVVPDAELGDTVVATFEGAAGGPTILLIGHLDTVFDPGTVAERPFSVNGNIAMGPGVTDMKGGLLTGLYALRVLRDLAGGGDAWVPAGRVIFVANPDEEIGSPVSSPVIRRLAADADAALVLECARANGDFVSSRKGIWDVELRITGRSAHAGVEPEKGRSALLEAAHKVIALHALNGRWPGVTVNAGVISGGTRPNVVTERCSIQVDVRAVQRATLEAAEAAVREIAASSTVPDTTCEVVQMGRHWPMEKLERSTRLVEHTIGLAAGLGFATKDAATGGASDANTTAGMGVASIDGLGPIGGEDHSPREYLEVDSIAPRTALVAALIATVGRDPVVRGWRASRGA
ncbi:MAG: M20 family metallopeptidase [Chloroflexota bacterium]